MTPRFHQVEAIKWIMALLQKGQRRGVVQMPTGSGKSYVAMCVVLEWLRMGGHATILAPSEEVITQLQLLALQLGLCPVIEKAELRASRFARLVIGSFHTMWRRYEDHKKPRSLVILDECHHFNFDAPTNLKIASIFDYAIGFSATPWSNGCMDFFENQVHVYPLSQAVVDGVCCGYALCPWREPTPGRYQVVYCSGLDEIQAMCGRIAPSDYAVYQQKHARETISRFRFGALGTIVVNRMLTEGFDQPQIKRVWIARETESQIFALQMAGRALRPYQGQRAEIYVASDTTYQTLQSAITQAG